MNALGLHAAALQGGLRAWEARLRSDLTTVSESPLEREPSMDAGCTHLDQVQDVRPSTSGCEECLAIGDRWVHLRLCRTCGHVGCCDSSKNKHATRHFHTTGHPIIQSLERGEDWGWCYVDAAMVDLP